jgi:WD40 repeat protein
MISSGTPPIPPSYSASTFLPSLVHSNYLVKMGMHETLEVFENEFASLSAAGAVPSAGEAVPDVYAQNLHLTDQLQSVRQEMDRLRLVTDKARETYDKLKKERDFHRANHKRVAQEKTKLVKDLKRVSAHVDQYEPALAAVEKKYQLALKDRMLARLEAERLTTRVAALEESLSNYTGIAATTRESKAPTDSTKRRKSAGATPSRGRMGATGTAAAGGRSPDAKTTRRRPSTEVPPAEPPFIWPTDLPVPRDVLAAEDAAEAAAADASGIAEGLSPLAAGRRGRAEAFPACDADTFTELHRFQAHGPGAGACTCLAAHPTRPVVATGGDDSTWRLWMLPQGEAVLSGEGHADWVSSVAFHPSGARLSTACGDGTVKLWDFATQSCTHTFTAHPTGPCWSASWHCAGNVILTTGQDHTARLWDVTRAVSAEPTSGMPQSRALAALRGHVDSVNCGAWLPFCSVAVTGSGDKTVSLWDPRTGQAVQTLYGHTNAIRGLSSSRCGTTLVSCDADGGVILWDLRRTPPAGALAAAGAIGSRDYPYTRGPAGVAVASSVAGGALAACDCGPYAINGVACDASGRTVACACDDGNVRVIRFDSLLSVGTDAQPAVTELSGHQDCVLAVAFDCDYSHLVSADATGAVRVWR